MMGRLALVRPHGEPRGGSGPEHAGSLNNMTTGSLSAAVDTTNTGVAVGSRTAAAVVSVEVRTGGPVTTGFPY